MTAKRSPHFKHVDPWPFFNPEVVTEAEAAQRVEFDALAHRFVEKRFAGDPTARAEVEAMLFAPTIERPTYYGRSPYRRAS